MRSRKIEAGATPDGWSNNALIQRNAHDAPPALCCGHTEAFETAQDAFEESWDVAPYFTLQPLCSLCLSAPVIILGLEGARRLHTKAHKEWKKHGRPAPVGAVTNETPNQDQN